MEKITTDISTFENLRKDGYVYVDKTDLLWRLVSSREGRQFFISRPRRFGKSLMLSTLRAIFEGRSDLFKGLKIEKHDYDWKHYPVVMLNMADVVAPTVDKLRENLSSMVKGLIRGFELEGVDIVSASGKTPDDFEGCTATVDELDVCDALTLPVKALMYQSGYLTIKKVIGEANGIDEQKLVLGVPNREVRSAIRSGWFDSIVKVPATEFDALVDVAKKQVAAGDLRALVGESLYRIYAKIPPEWRIRSEADVKRHFRLFMEMLGAKVAAEEGAAFGYADAIIETRRFVWVFEFKFNRSAKRAVRQIREKGHVDQYKGDRRPVTLVGINFRTAKRNIDEPVFEEL